MTAKLHHTDWLSGHVPDGVRAQIRRLIEVLGYLPHVQPLGVVTADAVLLAANRPLLDLLGAVDDELLGLDWSELMPGWEQRVDGWERDGDPRTHTFEDYLHGAGADGRRWVHVVASPVLADGGPAPVGGQGAGPVLAAWTLFISDRTPHARAEDAQRRDEVLDLLLDIPGEYAMKLDGRCRYEFVSPSLCRVLGVKPVDLLGQHIGHTHDGVGGFSRAFGTLWEDLNRAPYRAEREMDMRVGEEVRVVSWAFEALIEDGGAVRGVVGLGRDVTDRRRAEDAVRRRLQLETMLAEVSSLLVNAGGDALESVFESVLPRLGEGSSVDGVTLCELTPDRLSTGPRRAWRRGVGFESGVGGVSLADLPWLRERLQRCEIVAVAAVDDLPLAAYAERRMCRELGLSSILVAPLALDGLLYGWISLQTGARREWGEDDFHVLRVLAGQLAAELVSAADARNLETVSRTFLSFGPDCARNLRAVCAAAGLVSGADFVLYSRLRDDDIELAASWGAPADLPPVTADTGNVCYDVLFHDADDVRILGDLDDTVYALSSPIVRRSHARTFAGYPVRVGDRRMASLCAFFGTTVQLRPSQVELLRVLGRAAAVEESRRIADEERILGIAELERAMERTVATLSSALGARDPYTTGHEVRVAALATAMGEEMGLSAADLRLLSLAATVHDIGKIVVPAEFLSKPTRLSEAEFAVIKQHCQAGYDLLRPAALPGPVMDAVIQHHERLDGSGYPEGLRGDEIGAFGRILAVADVAEAMSSDRPYRPALGIEPALAELERGRGTLFDPVACDACVTLFRDKQFGFTD